MLRNVKRLRNEESLKSRIITIIKNQQALQKHNGNDNAFVKLSTLYKILKATTERERAQIRGVLNHDYLNGSNTFERKIGGNGAYRLYDPSLLNTYTVESSWIGKYTVDNNTFTSGYYDFIVKSNINQALQLCKQQVNLMIETYNTYSCNSIIKNEKGDTVAGYYQDAEINKTEVFEMSNRDIVNFEY